MDTNLLSFFTTNYGRGSVALVGTSDSIGEAIRIAQRELTLNGKPLLWSHAFILGEIRPDRRAPDLQHRSPYLFESDLHIDPVHVQLRNGAQENWIGKWCQDHVEHAAILDLTLTGPEQDVVLGTALQLCDEQMEYPVLELLGTWIAIITGHVWVPNPFNDPHQIYCSAFARYCCQQAGRDFLGGNIDLSNTAPEHIGQAKPFKTEWHKVS